MNGHQAVMDASEVAAAASKKDDKEAATTTVVPVISSSENIVPVDVAVNEPLTVKSAITILTNPLTWLPALAYMTTFGFELAVDSVLAHVLLDPHPELGQLNAGYLASVFGLLNIWTRPMGGFVADILYARWGIKTKKYWTLACVRNLPIFQVPSA
jgi:NNP family nitrate/nitrite transporter-like MFS transporter